MTTKKKRKAKSDELAARRVPALVSYLHPFRLVEVEGAKPWKLTIENVNKADWDYVALHEVVGGLDVGLTSPYHLVVARDGALALPPIPQLRQDQTAVEFFNKCLAALLLGGVYCEAITVDNLEFGSLIDWKYLRVSSNAAGASNRFHYLIRMQAAAPIEAIALMRPRTVAFSKLQEAIRTGFDVLSAIPEMSGEFLLKGVTATARRDWGSALANHWIVVEQIAAHLWRRYVLNTAASGPAIEGRREQLEDSRTWTTSTRQELLFQKSILDANTLRTLSRARKARNALVHRGAHPTEEAAFACYDAVLSLMKIVLAGAAIPLATLRLRDHTLSDPFRPPVPRRIDPQYWHPIPKLPGEEELEKMEAQIVARSPRKAAKGSARGPKRPK